LRPLVHWSVCRPWGRSIGDGLTLILDIGNIARIGIQNIVGNNLGAAIRKSNTVFSIGSVSIAVLIVGILSASSVSISLNSISKVIDWGSILVDWSWSISWDWGRSVRRNWSWGVCQRSGAVGSWCNSDNGSSGNKWSRCKSDERERCRGSSNEGCGGSSNDRCRLIGAEDGLGPEWGLGWCSLVGVCVVVTSSVSQSNGDETSESNKYLK
jgi:hypothetical protein